MKGKVSGGGQDALWFLSNVNDQSGWTIGWGESARDDVFYIPAILVARVAMLADEHDVRESKAMSGIHMRNLITQAQACSCSLSLASR
jgi:hypothetical protein